MKEGKCMIGLSGWPGIVQREEFKENGVVIAASGKKESKHEEAIEIEIELK